MLIVEGGQIIESELVGEGEHLGFGFVHLLKADFVNLFRRQIGCGHLANFETVACRSVGQDQMPGRCVHARVVLAHEVCEML